MGAAVPDGMPDTRRAPDRAGGVGPAILTLGTGLTPGERPDTSVAERLAEVGVTVDRIEEEVSVHRLREVEARRLALEPGTAILPCSAPILLGGGSWKRRTSSSRALPARLPAGFPVPAGADAATRTGRLPRS